MYFQSVSGRNLAHSRLSWKESAFAYSEHPTHWSPKPSNTIHYRGWHIEIYVSRLLSRITGEYSTTGGYPSNTSKAVFDVNI